MMSDFVFRCGLEAVLGLLNGKWKLLILYHLQGERLRFSTLRRCIGRVSEKMLSQQLKEMTSDGLVKRIDHKTVPPHVEYELTPLGRELTERLRPLCDWGTENMAQIVKITSERETPPKAFKASH